MVYCICGRSDVVVGSVEIDFFGMDLYVEVEFIMFLNRWEGEVCFSSCLVFF